MLRLRGRAVPAALGDRTVLPVLREILVPDRRLVLQLGLLRVGGDLLGDGPDELQPQAVQQNPQPEHIPERILE